LKFYKELAIADFDAIESVDVKGGLFA
jgi:hypothetical protein